MMVAYIRRSDCGSDQTSLECPYQLAEEACPGRTTLTECHRHGFLDRSRECGQLVQQCT